MVGNDWIRTGKKFLWALAEIIVAGTIAYFADNQGFLVLVPMFEGIRNWIKHRND